MWYRYINLFIYKKSLGTKIGSVRWDMVDLEITAANVLFLQFPQNKSQRNSKIKHKSTISVDIEETSNNFHHSILEPFLE